MPFNFVWGPRAGIIGDKPTRRQLVTCPAMIGQERTLHQAGEQEGLKTTCNASVAATASRLMPTSSCPQGHWHTSSPTPAPPALAALTLILSCGSANLRAASPPPGAAGRTELSCAHTKEFQLRCTPMQWCNFWACLSDLTLCQGPPWPPPILTCWYRWPCQEGVLACGASCQARLS